ncbi:MAG: adenylate/guanylate cyclase domain-containing protein [Betaproteobacteria bacterium]
MDLDYDELAQSLSMTEIVRLQSALSLALRQRFERKLAVAFSDIVESTRYFAKFGDEAGRHLQQRHLDLLQQALDGAGRIANTAGDGALLAFPTVDAAVASLIRFLRLNSADNTGRERDRQLAVRIGVHYGSVLTDDVQITGDSVNLCSRVTASATPGEIRLTRDAFYACSDTGFRTKCRPIAPVKVKGIDAPVAMFVLDWRDRSVFPASVQLETGEELPLPEQDIITFGRLRDLEGEPANDIVLRCGDETHTKRISRWHFELRRRENGFVLRTLSNAATEVNGQRVAKDEECPIRPGDSVRVSDVLLLRFSPPPAEADGATLFVKV